MSFLSTFFTLLLITTAVLGAPTAPKPSLKRRSFEIPRVRRANYIPHGPAALRKAYGKFNITAAHLGLDSLDFQAVKHHPSSTAAAANNSTNGTEDGSVAAVATSGDTEFVAAVTVGGQTMMMDFDTGSSDL